VIADAPRFIRRLAEADADAYADLRREALRDAPLGFAASPSDDVASSAEAVREQLRHAPGGIILGAFQPELVGAVGIFRDRHVKASHKMHLWGLYVVPGRRRQGVASALLQAALAHARTLPGVDWVHLCVTSAVPGAIRLYERAGFQTWGIEPEALRHEGQSVVDHHMALRL
jgi:ribosomal protein S18 acetylase RimI-like enzyme